jgi:hypothetical protein
MRPLGTIAGQQVGSAQLDEIRRLLGAHPDWHRSRLSVELCRRWGLRGADGTLKDMGCRNLLLKLERAGHVTLPAARHGSPNRRRNRTIAAVAHDTAAVTAVLSVLEPLSVTIALRGTPEERLFNCLVSRYHYLGLRSTVGENLKYVVRAVDGRPLACLLFGSAAWKTEARDQFVGWDPGVKERRLQWLTNNTRFVILPWVRVRCLASRILSLVARRVRADWESKYGHPVALLETFVDTSRFRGTCYRAANWLELGLTSGRTRNSTSTRPCTSRKAVFVLPLIPGFRKELCQ